VLFVASARVNASSTNLQVAGTLSPGPACEMTVGNGLLDLGRISIGDLNPDPSKPTRLESKRVKMRIDCANARRYALVANGSSLSASGDPIDFGLVSEGDGSPAGSLYARLDSASAHIEGKAAYYTATDQTTGLETAAWGPSSFSVMPVPQGYAIGFVTTDGSYAAPSAIKNFDTYLLVDPGIRPVSELDLTGKITFTGTLGFDINYF
jgi:hypothetical protein